MIAYISTETSGVGLITSEDQEVNGLKFEIIDTSNNVNIIKVEGLQEKIISWTTRVNGVEIIDYGLELAKNKKLKELDDLCTSEILAGFISSALGVEHQYGFDRDDQDNLDGRMTMIAGDPTYPDTFLWKTKDAGQLFHTKTQFIKLCRDADTFKDSRIAKYWTLKPQVLNATTEDEVNAIIW